MPTDYPANTASNTQITPEVLWAQRSSKDDADKNYIYLTISVPDVATSSMKLDMQPSKLTFTGHSDTKKATYHVELNFLEDIDPDSSKIKHSDRDVEIKLQKKELKEAYWPRLLKDKAKVHFLKTDFEKWIDEDEQDGVPDDDYMSQFGGGMDGGFGGLDFSKLGAGGAGDAGGLEGGLGGDDSDDDDGMPDLEGDDDADADADGDAAEEAGDGDDGAATAAAKGKGRAKIEEVDE